MKDERKRERGGSEVVMKNGRENEGRREVEGIERGEGEEKERERRGERERREVGRETW